MLPNSGLIVLQSSSRRRKALNLVVSLTGSNPAVSAWGKLVIAVIDSLQKYVKQWHTTGVAWNPQVSNL